MTTTVITGKKLGQSRNHTDWIYCDAILFILIDYIEDKAK